MERKVQYDQGSWCISLRLLRQPPISFYTEIRQPQRLAELHFRKCICCNRQPRNCKSLLCCSPPPARLFDIRLIPRVGCSGLKSFASHVKRIWVTCFLTALPLPAYDIVLIVSVYASSLIRPCISDKLLTKWYLIVLLVRSKCLPRPWRWSLKFVSCVWIPYSTVLKGANESTGLSTVQRSVMFVLCGRANYFRASMRGKCERDLPIVCSFFVVATRFRT
jgi:hypothetical protein